MKFSCDRCQTRYSIGDEKVRGKVLKIRCKTCGNIVVVREQTGLQQAAMQPVVAAGASAGLTTTGGSQPLPPMVTTGGAPRGDHTGAIDWYVAIKGKQHGPAKKDDVARLYREGKITERTYLWNETMAAWTRLKEVPTFAFLLAEAPGKRPPPPPVDDHSGEQQQERQGAEIIPFDEARRAREQGNSFGTPSGGVAAMNNDPFAAVSSPNVGGDGAPRDSTRVFIMQAGLHNRNQKHKVYAGVAGAAIVLLGTALFLDFQGIIAIPGLHSVVNVVTQREDKPKEPTTEMAAWDSAEEDPKLKCKLLPNPEECVKQTLALNEIKRARRKARAAQDNTLDPSNFQVGEPGGDRRLGAPTGLGGTAEISDPTQAAKIAAVFKNEEKKITVPKPKIEPVAISGSDIDAESVMKTINQNSESIRSCVEQGAKVGNVPTGKQQLILGIEPNGRVSKATFRSGPTNASQVGECIRDAARRWKFQAFPGAAADVEVPLILSVGM